MNKEMKETLDKVAAYEEWVKEKALKAGNLAFATMFLISVGAIIIQLILAVNLRLILGETVTALAGGIVYSFIMVHNGIWDKGLSKKNAIWRDFLTSVICAGIFTVIYGILLGRMGASETQVIRLSLIFLVGITIVGFIVLRILSFFNQKRRENLPEKKQKDRLTEEMEDTPKDKLISTSACTKIYNARDVVEAGRLIELLNENGIAAFSQETGASVAMHGATGFGIYGVDVLVKTDEAEKALQIIHSISEPVKEQERMK